MPRSSGVRITSISTLGAAIRRFIIGIRLCPPASTAASSPCSASAPSASSHVSGARYSNALGFTAARAAA